MLHRVACLTLSCTCPVPGACDGDARWQHRAPSPLKCLLSSLGLTNLFLAGAYSTPGRPSPYAATPGMSPGSAAPSAIYINGASPLQAHPTHQWCEPPAGPPHTLVVRAPCRPTPGSPDPCCALTAPCAGLPNNATEQDIRDELGVFGEIEVPVHLSQLAMLVSLFLVPHACG